MSVSFASPARRALALAILSIAFVACGDDDSTPSGDAGGDGGGSLGGDAATPDAGGNQSMGLLTAPEAEEVATLELDEPVTDVVYAEDLPIGLHQTDGASILDMSDPEHPAILAALPSTGRVVGVAIDVQLRLLFVVTVSGDLRVFRVSDPSNPIQLAQITLTETGAGSDSMKGLVRVNRRLMVLGGASLLPVQIQFGAGSSVSLLAEDQVDLDTDPRLIATGAGVVYVVFAGGKIQVWSATSSPAMLDQGALGADAVGLIARGHRLFVALAGLGLRVVDMSVKGSPRVLFTAPELDDLEGLERFGNLVLVALSRGMVVALDLSDIEAPRALVRRSGALPDWIAAIGGNLVLGGGTNLSILGVPPFVAATLPQPMTSSFPRYGRIPLQLSKPIDPRTVTLANVSLRCGGTVITGTLSVSLDNLRITFLPADTLPADVTCDLTLQNVLDALGNPVVMPPSGISFTTATQAPAPIENPKSSWPHTADGDFTDWAPGMDQDFEYFDVKSAQGMYSRFYADFDGEKLWMLNDWFYNGDDIDPDCYNQFGVWTGNGSQQWEIRAYGDQRLEVLLNGQLLAEDDARVEGGYSFVATPNDEKPHTVYEIAITTDPGSWGVQLHDPGPTFSCQQLETDPTNYAGSSTMQASTIDPTQPPSTPDKPQADIGGVGSGTPTLTWPIGDGASAFTSYLIEVSTGDDLSNVFYRITVYGGQLTLPPGLLQAGMTYTFRVTAYNLAGSVGGDPTTFTVPGGEQAGAPTLSGVQPNGVTQGQASSITISGQGFVEGARVYLNGNAVSTTFENSTTLIAMLTREDTAMTGTFDITVRNVPGDADTESNAVKLSIDEPSSDLVTLVELDLSSITEAVSTDVTATLTNAPSGGTYYLVLTPDAGGEPISFTCTSDTDNTCTAKVNASPDAVYDVKIQVGTGQGAYDTNTLNQALTVTAPLPACAHSACLPGGRLTSGCDACVTAVCASMQSCCSTAWTGACVTAADTNVSCTSCQAPTLATPNTLQPATQESDDTTQVMVRLQDEPNPASGYTFKLRLTPVGQIDGTLFDCGSYSSIQHTCTATVSGLAEGPYNAAVDISDTGVVPQTYTTAALDSAFSVTAPTGPAGCFSGGTMLAPGGSGVCAQPYVIDLSGQPIGTTYYHDVGAGGGNENFGASGTSCGWTGTQQRVVYQVLLPANAGFEVSADAASTFNPRIAILEDSSCTQPANICIDDGGAGQCEVATAEVGTGTFFGTSPYFVVGTDDAGGSLLVRIRTIPGQVTLESLSPMSMSEGTQAQVDVTMTNADNGLYYLKLHPTLSGGADAVFACIWQSSNHCTANVTGITAFFTTDQPYDATIQVGEGVGQYDTNTLSSAFTVLAP